MKLDLGSGPQPVEGFEGVDRVPGTHHAVDLITGIPWPWADGSIEALRCSHFIEHIPATDVFVTEWEGIERTRDNDGDPPGRWVDSLIFFFEQAYRVIVPGGLFEVIWPPLKSTFAFQDPTHRRFIPGRLLMYLSREFRENNRLQYMGARCDWVVSEFAATVLRPELEPKESAAALAFMSEAERFEVIAKIEQRAELERESHWDRVSEYRAVLVAHK